MIKSTPIENYKNFYSMVEELARVYGVLENPDIKRAIEILLEKTGQCIGMVKDTKERKHEKAIKFFAIYRQKYISAIDSEPYDCNFGAEEIKIAEYLIEKLEASEISIEEYIDWLFDVFYPSKKGKISANLRFSLSNSALQDFMYNNADILKEKRKEKKRAMDNESILALTRKIIRETENADIKKALKDYSEGYIQINKLAIIITEFLKNNKKPQEK